MAHLSLSLLGPLQVSLDGEPITQLNSDKVRALLAYLAVEADRPHRRQTLAGLLWPDRPESKARGNLRHAIFVLGQATANRDADPPFLLITRETIQFNPDSDHWLDASAFEKRVEADSLDELERAIALYRGDFLDGFSPRDSPEFDDWVVLMRERLQRMAMAAYRSLAEHCAQRGDYERACDYARRRVELEPWQEGAHRQVMRLLAQSGQRTAALAQYEACRQKLEAELGVAPARETTDLYERIRDGRFLEAAPPMAQPGRLPGFLRHDDRYETPLFVAREQELAQLDEQLGHALRGEGRVVFVTGEAGSGKTALVQEFCRRAQERYTDLVAATGRCNAHTGIGDPYLAFREILSQLAGDVESRWSAGSMSRDQATRLWQLIPLTCEALEGAGGELIDIFLQGEELVERANQAAGPESAWLVRLQRLMETLRARGGAQDVQQSALFSQYTRVLQRLSVNRPLFLILEDLHWADAGSTSLLFHLGRHLENDRILVVGVHRPLSQSLDDGSERHPLEPVIHELQQRFGEIQVDLGQADGRGFVEAYLDHRPNRLGREFRDALYRQSGGNALLVAELLRSMYECGDIFPDEAGALTASPSLSWESLPARIEAVLGERLARLSTSVRNALKVGSAEGETFTAEVVAQVLDCAAQWMVQSLSGEAGGRHGLVIPDAIRRLDGQRLSGYRFRHILMQRYVYGAMDPAERQYLHESVGHALEGLYGDRAGEIAVQLARHYEQAGDVEGAVRYLRQAGERATRFSAHQEALGHYSRGLELLAGLPEGLKRDETELALRYGLSCVLRDSRGYSAPKALEASEQALALCRKVGETPLIFPLLMMVHLYHFVRAEYEPAMEIAERVALMAQEVGVQLLFGTNYYMSSLVWLQAGQFSAALSGLAKIIDIYERGEPEIPETVAWISNVGLAYAWTAFTMSLVGYQDQAIEVGIKSLELLRSLDYPLHENNAISVAGTTLRLIRREFSEALRWSEEELAFARANGLVFFESMGLTHLGWANAELGRIDEGIGQIMEGLAIMEANGIRAYRTCYLAPLAEALGRVGRVDEGLSRVREALDMAEETGERLWEAELWRIRAGLVLTRDGSHSEVEAEENYRKAIAVAQRQKAKTLELRAALDLGRLMRRQGREEDAAELVRTIYAWFTEGFDTLDLVEARAFLGESPRG